MHAIIGMFAVVLAGIVYTRIIARMYALNDRPDQIHFIETRDKVRIALFRYTPRGADPHATPVLFCHGLGANMRNFDLMEGYSLARYMADNGYDSWILNLRGANVKGIIEYQNWDFGFDDFVKSDIPAAVEHVLDRTKKQALCWIGHSMGGMLLYAYLLTGGDRFVSAGVTMGSPVRFSASKDLSRLVKLRPLLRLTTRVHADLFARSLAPLTGVLNTSFVKTQMNVRNVDTRIIRVAQYNAVTPISTKLLSQFGGWLGKHSIALSDGFDITENLDKITTPVLVIAGRGDGLVPSDATSPVYDKVRSPDKAFVELSVVNGFSADYGHIDMVFGKNAPTEVYPLVRKWLDTRRAVAAGDNASA